MSGMTRRTAWVAALLLLGAVAPAQERKAPPPRPKRTFSSLLNVDALVDNYLRFVARKYNLTPEQEAFTEQLVRARVDEFLGRHQDELTDLVDQLFAARTGEDLTQAELMEWGRRMNPLYEEAKLIIVEANDEWRTILTEEQKRIHDEDLKLMYESFATTEDQLQRLMSGEMTLEEFRNPSRARQERLARQRASAGSGGEVAAAGGRTTVTPKVEDAGGVARLMAERNRAARSASSGSAGCRTAVVTRRSRSPASKSGRGSDAEQVSKWEQYVQQFIERYQLNAEQQSRAYKILKRCQEQAENYLRTRKPQIEKLDRQLSSLKDGKDKDKAKQAAELRAKRQKLLEPIDRIFEEQLKPKLERIPTRAQREAAQKSKTGKPSPAPRRKADNPRQPDTANPDNPGGDED